MILEWKKGVREQQKKAKVIFDEPLGMHKMLWIAVTSLNGQTYNSLPWHVMGSLHTTWWGVWRETVGHQQHVCHVFCSLQCACPLGHWEQGCLQISPKVPKPRCPRWTWARGASLWFFSYHDFCIAQVHWATSQTGTITFLAQEISFPRGQLIHTARLHCLTQYGCPQ